MDMRTLSELALYCPGEKQIRKLDDYLKDVKEK